MNRPFRLRFFIIFTFLAAALIGFMDWKMFGSMESSTPDVQLTLSSIDEPGEIPAMIEPAAGTEFMPAEDFAEIFKAPVIVEPDTGDEYFDYVPDQVSAVPVIEQPSEPKAPDEQPIITGNPKIAIIIDDVGMNIAESNRTVNLPAPVTVAILPYAERARDYAAEAIAGGHEIIIHTPMEAMSADVDLGPLALRTTDTPEQLKAMFENILASFDGYVGINNHMGSKFTQDMAAMDVVMEMLKDRNLFFVDSRTIHTSVAEDVATHFGVPFAQRDVFLDHEEGEEYVMRALSDLERIAIENGHAIAIGHPKEDTIDVLKRWMPSAAKRGIDFVPVSELTRRVGPAALNSAAPVEPAPAQSQPRG